MFKIKKIKIIKVNKTEKNTKNTIVNKPTTWIQTCYNMAQDSKIGQTILRVWRRKYAIQTYIYMANKQTKYFLVINRFFEICLFSFLGSCCFCRHCPVVAVVVSFRFYSFFISFCLDILLEIGRKAETKLAVITIKFSMVHIQQQQQQQR